MFKFTIIIAALALSVSLAIDSPEQRQSTVQRQQMQEQWEVQRDPMAAAATVKQKPDKVLYVTEVTERSADHGISELLESALIKLVKIPKKAAGLMVKKFKSLSAKGLLKGALIVGLVATVITIAVQFNLLMGGQGVGEHDYWYSESNIDYVTDFVSGAFDQYGQKQ